MTAGTYTIRVNKELMFFEPITVKIAPNTPQLPDIITAGFVWPVLLFCGLGLSALSLAFDITTSPTSFI